MSFEKLSFETNVFSNTNIVKNSEGKPLFIPEKVGEDTRTSFTVFPQKIGENNSYPFNIYPEKVGENSYPVFNIEKERSISGNNSSINSNSKGLKDNSYFKDISQRFDEGVNKMKHAANKVFIEHDDPRRYSTPQERLNYTPKNTGEWIGERADSKFVPNSVEAKEVLSKYGLDGIKYKNGIPDFSSCAESRIKIDMMNPLSRYLNFKQYDINCAELWSKNGRDGKYDWTARDIKNWRENNNYTWHECNDRKTAQLVPSEIHSACTHLGGISEMKNYYKVIVGGFDE